MIVMLDTSQDLMACSKELGAPVEQLFTPLTRYNAQRPKDCFGIDNGAFSRFDEKAFLSTLQKHSDRISLCRFVAVPDVVGDARRTLEVFDRWCDRISEWKLALVAQDGLESFSIPWEKIAAVFIGGSTAWKVGPHAAAVVRAAKMLGKWVHAGRVNTPGRYEYFEELGADSCDGTGLSRYSHMRKAIYTNSEAPRLF